MSVYRRNLLMNVGGGTPPVPPVVISENDGKYLRCITPTYERLTYMSFDWGENWYTGWKEEVYNPPHSGDYGGGYMIGISPNGQHLAAISAEYSSEKNLYVSHDEGVNWEGIKIFGNNYNYKADSWFGNCTKILIDNTGLNIMAFFNEIGLSYDQLYVSHDAGKNWEHVLKTESGDWFAVACTAASLHITANNKIIINDDNDYNLRIIDGFTNKATLIDGMQNYEGSGNRAAVSADGTVMVNYTLFQNGRKILLYNKGDIQFIEYPSELTTDGYPIIFITPDNKKLVLYGAAWPTKLRCWIYDLETGKWGSEQVVRHNSSTGGAYTDTFEKYDGGHIYASMSLKHIYIYGYRNTDGSFTNFDKMAAIPSAISRG